MTFGLLSCSKSNRCRSTSEHVFSTQFRVPNFDHFQVFVCLLILLKHVKAYWIWSTLMKYIFFSTPSLDSWTYHQPQVFIYLLILPKHINACWIWSVLKYIFWIIFRFYNGIPGDWQLAIEVLSVMVLVMSIGCLSLFGKSINNFVTPAFSWDLRVECVWPLGTFVILGSNRYLKGIMNIV